MIAGNNKRASAGGAASARRALFIVITDYPGGAERVSFNLATELASRPRWQVEVQIVSSKLTDSFSESVLPSAVRISYGPSRNWSLSFLLLPLRLIFRRYDLVFTTHVHTNALLSLLRTSGLTSVGRLVLRESTSVFDQFTGLKARRFRWLYQIYGGEDLVIAQTGYMADHVRPRLPPESRTHLEVLPNPVNASAIKLAASLPLDHGLVDQLQGRRNVLFCGRLIAVKRPDLAIKAFRIGAADAPDAQLVFLGEGPLEESLRHEVAEAGLSGRVLFFGNRSNPYPVVTACKYGLVTSAREGFPNVIIEMMACGVKKVVTTPCAGDLHLLKDVAVTRTHELADIARALRAALDSDEDCSALYSQMAASRSVATYLDRVLGI
jgi:glycosyltransferase involved in cell wall biosynthesis